MSSNPTLIIMAAGMGSRYGGLKQIDPITDQGEIILDFSLYDAMLAGFQDVIFIIKKENEEDFRSLIDGGAGKRLNIQYAYQDIKDLPGIRKEDIHKVDEAIDAGRQKPWGTGHAVLSARDLVRGPFAVINADDFYGAAAFQHMYDFLEGLNDQSPDSSGDKYHFAMVGYQLEKTLSETGHVARGVCTLSPEGFLEDIVERTQIERRDGEGICFTEDEKTWIPLPGDTTVSMNFWGFSRSMMDHLRRDFPEALSDILAGNPLKGEYYLPGAVDKLLKAGQADVKVLASSDQWYGVTYKEDKEGVMNALRSMKDKGLYPEKLWN